MGGKSSSSNQTNNTTITENTQLSNAFNADMNGVLLSGIEGSTVNVTDGGAAKAALAAMTGASDAAIKGMVSANANNNDLSKYVVGQNTSLAELLGTKALVNAQSATTDAMDIMKTLSTQSDAGTAQQLTKYFMIGAVALGVAMAFKGRF
ncbi:hypothetical protein [Vibrio anguillarum]|uniref:Uncharacterized protein n=2 Tax=root TaxID=1 RepID=A0A3G1SVN7_9VIRU|nr:hypothetical protein [Vibrio anguillarum]AXU40228.1 hypothetical protein fNo16_0015 [Vibrio phage fNo16]QYS24667.1 hypothetical protein fNO16VIB134_0015 [Vibrio phage NO16-like VIB134]QYS24759.1 hypothetical protein fNO16NB10_0015 [Vibrio phage NO16-like NB10]QYS24782.1 hypothetical protein fNO1690148_0015 [Vibrio phage NO16-like 9014_8]QYS24805.1 hypothetical protein fNO16117890_0015 [Vibrio phage NO16-like 1178_90]QYS24828.1 hypothetical protein fNO1660191_0015 [Vibrio phage NO16-like 60